MEDRQDIYTAPTSQLETDQQTFDPETVTAPRLKRFGTFIVDYILMLVVIFVLSIIAYLALGDEIMDNFLETTPNFFLNIIGFMLYHFPQEAFFGRTLGKVIFRTKVVNSEGLNISVGQALGRTLCRLIPFEPFSFFGYEGRGWHDSIPKTYVINTRAPSTPPNGGD